MPKRKRDSCALPSKEQMKAMLSKLQRTVEAAESPAKSNKSGIRQISLSGHARGGTGVALSTVAMRLSETITIYMAAGAPFAVSYFLHQRPANSRARLLLKSALTGFLWPLVALKFFLIREAVQKSEPAAGQALQPHEEKVEAARKSLQATIYTVQDLAAGAFGREREKLERTAYLLRESVEKYIGLSNAVAEASAGAPPDDRELELFRVAGRKGDDLLLAGSCIHRRNVARLREHHARARTELLHAFAEIGEVAGGPRVEAGGANAAASRRLSIETLGLYVRAVDLLSLLEDEAAAMSVAQLLNQECQRLRRLQAASEGHETKPETREGLCIAHTSRLPRAPSPNETGLAQG